MAVAAYFVADTFTTLLGIVLGIGVESNSMYLALGNGVVGIVVYKVGLTLFLVGFSVLLTITNFRCAGISALVAITVGGVLATLNNLVTILTGISLFHGWMGLSILWSQYLVLFTMLLVAITNLAIMNLMAPRNKSNRAGQDYKYMTATKEMR